MYCFENPILFVKYKGPVLAFLYNEYQSYSEYHCG